MKTIKKKEKIDSELFTYKRVSDDIADKQVRDEGWEFCPKTEWKNNVRDLNKKTNKKAKEE